MEVAMVMEVEDDVFFADLNRQISLLITDDEDDQSYYSSFRTSAVSFQQVGHTQAFSGTSAIYPSSAQPQYKFDHHSSSFKTTTTDHQSKGTGVFIPKSSQFTKRRSSKHQSKTTTNHHINYYNSYNSNNKNNYKLSYRQHQKQQQLPSRGFFCSSSDPQELLAS